MPQHQSFDRDMDSWPAYMACAFGLDTEWKADAACRRPGIAVHAAAWTGTIGSQVKRSEASKMRKMALATCLTCQVQWECVKFAIATGDTWNIAAIRPADRAALAKVDSWESFVDMAEEAGVAVADLLRSLREASKQAAATERAEQASDV